jgi:transketolase
VSVISVHTIKPLDVAGIREVLSHHKSVVVLEEHVPHGGLASRVKEVAWDMGATCKLQAVSLKDEFIHFYGSHAELLAEHGLTAQRVVEIA